jgi:hypothetical protein
MIIEARCDLSELEPEFREDMTALLERSPYGWVILSGYRSLLYQKALWEDYRFGRKHPTTGERVPGDRGPRAAPPGKSAHNYGLAVDVVLDIDPVKPGLQPSWRTDLPGWLWLKSACTAHPRLKNGWSFGDWPHIEKYRWDRHIGWQRPRDNGVLV